MADYSKVKVGDTVWYSDVNRKGLTKGVIAKVGRKLITLEGGGGLTFRKDTGQTNDAYQHQTLILDFEANRKVEAVKHAWKWLYNNLSFTPNEGVELGDVFDAARILRIKIE